MAGIRTEMSDGRGGTRPLTHNDPEYWEGQYFFQMFPAAAYRAYENDTGQIEVESKRVNSEGELKKLGSGWFIDEDEARQYLYQLERDVAKAAAEVNAAAVTMSPKAQRELAAQQARDEFEMTTDVKKAKH